MPATSARHNTATTTTATNHTPADATGSHVPVAGGGCTSPSASKAIHAPTKRRRLSAKKAFDALIQGRGHRDGRAVLCIPKLAFRKLVEEIASECKSDLRFQLDAMITLQEDAEMLVIERFKRCARLAELCRKDTVRDEHWNFVREDEEQMALPYSGRS
jgi:histone H3/H4